MNPPPQLHARDSRHVSGQTATQASDGRMGPRIWGQGVLTHRVPGLAKLRESMLREVPDACGIRR